MPAPSPVIHVRDLRKRYGDLQAVDGVGFDVEPGEIFGILGPNGAGKTTTVEIVEGLRTADSGVVEVLGQDLFTQRAAVKAQIGIALQTATLIPNLTARETLALFGSFYPTSVSPNVLLERLGLTEKANAQVQTLSGGQQQRLSVALALVNEPRMVFLDEPTTGLDPQARRNLWDVILDLRASGAGVILTTHSMEEAERLCDRVAIMDRGQILALDTPEGLIRSHFSERSIRFAPPSEFDATWLERLPSVLRVDTEGSEVAVHSERVQRTLVALLDEAERAGYDLGDIALRRPTLEDVFLKLTGRRIRD